MLFFGLKLLTVIHYFLDLYDRKLSSDNFSQFLHYTKVAVVGNGKVKNLNVNTVNHAAQVWTGTQTQKSPTYRKGWALHPQCA